MHRLSRKYSQKRNPYGNEYEEYEENYNKDGWEEMYDDEYFQKKD